MRYLTALVMLGLTAAAVPAHFIWIVPEKGSASTARVVFSDSLEPDDAVDVEKIAATRLATRDAAGKVADLGWKKGEHSYLLNVPGTGPTVVGGSCRYGVMSRGKGKPYLLAYHPKMIRGQVSGARGWDRLPLEIVPVEDGRLQVLFDGKPVSGAEVVVLGSGEDKETLTTDARGEVRTRPMKAGLHGVRARHIEAKAGEYTGKKYEEIRHYATLVFRSGEAASDRTKATGSAKLAPLPVGVSSLGAIACDGYLYVYGGHAGKTHRYDTRAVLGTFHRLKLDGGTKWEELPGGPILQGMNLATHDGKVYRVGGMQPRNAPGEPADNHSVPDVARFDPKVGKWETLPSLPAGRSSHDVVVAGDRLVVVGGWLMRGRGQKSTWHDTALILDLKASSPRWESVAQPFQRRALTATAVGSKVYVLGGLGSERTEGRVEILDVDTQKWSRGPDLPATKGKAMAFSPAAGSVDGRVVVNLSDGPVYRLTADGAGWEKVATAAQPRVVARLVPLGPGSAALIGGATGKGNVAEVEVVKLPGRGDGDADRR